MSDILTRAKSILKQGAIDWGYLATVKRQAKNDNVLGEDTSSSTKTVVYTNLPIVCDYKAVYKAETKDGIVVYEDVIEFNANLETTSNVEVNLEKDDIIEFDGIEHSIINVQKNSYIGWRGFLTNDG